MRSVTVHSYLLKNLTRMFGIAFFLTVALVNADAQETNLSEKVSQALNTFGPVSVTTFKQVPREVNVCQRNIDSVAHNEGPGDSWHQCHKEIVYDPIPDTTPQILSASHIRIIQSDPISYGTPIRTSLTDQLNVDDNLAQACLGAPPANVQLTLQKAFQRTATMQIQQTVTHSLSDTISGSLKLGVVDSFTITNSLQIGESVTTGQTTIESTQESVTRSRSISATVPPGTAIIQELKIWPVHFVVPFSTTVTIDADISQNNSHYALLSQMIPDAAKRTFAISGQLVVNDASEGELDQYEIAYDPSRCSGTSPVSVPHYRPSKDTKLIRMKK